jgi:tetratricopeptide (TPR) repeat protein
MPAPASSSTRVFLSYSWDSDAHKQRVLDLAQRLRNDGVDAWLDRFTPFPEQGWPQWMTDEINKAQFVVVIATEKYAQRFARQTPEGEGLGATWEGAIITNQLHKAGARNKKFMPAIFAAEDQKHIPEPLDAYSHFRVDGDDGYDALYRLITGQPDIVPVPLGSRRELPSRTATPKLAALPIPRVYKHATAGSNLPHLPYGFFGRDDELERIAGALVPGARTWGALIDGPGGIGKTALAIHAAELTPPGQFERVIFLSAKSQELTPDGARPLTNFIVPGYLNMLNELARQLDRAELTRTTEDDRPRELQRALQDVRALLVFDNLESLIPTDRDRLFNFLAYLPGGCKAIVTSRRRDDTDARVVRLGKLGKDAALAFIARLAEDRELLSRAAQAQRLALYENTGGNPLLIRWVAGQLGRGKCRTIADALQLLASAAADNDPLRFIFGDLVENFSATETKALAALSHFTTPMEVKFIAELAGLGRNAAQTALEDLKGRALVTGDEEGTQFAMLPLVADFLRRAKPEAVRETGDRLSDSAYALAVENGYDKHDHYPMLEADWPRVAAALPLLLEGDNERVQTMCGALGKFLRFSGRWDERISLSLQAEAKAIAAKDFQNAGWRSYDAGWCHYLRGESQEVMASVARSERHWEEAKAGANERAAVVNLRGLGHILARDYPAAIAAFRETIELWRSVSSHSMQVSIGLSSLAQAQHLSGDLDGAEANYREALRIAKMIDAAEGVATYTGNLAAVALERKDWSSAEALAREALPMSEKISSKQLVASNSARIARALARQNRKSEALPYAQRAVDLLTELRSPNLPWARGVLEECQS